MDDEGHLLGPGERGEIVVRGPLVMAGYYKNPEATADASRHGWHHTGDIGYLDGDGYLFIVDRAKDMIITGGFNVYSAEVEQVLLGHPAVQDCAVIGLPDEKWGERVTAVVQLRPGQPLPRTRSAPSSRIAWAASRRPSRSRSGPTCPAPRSARSSRSRSRPSSSSPNGPGAAPASWRSARARAVMTVGSKAP